MPTNALHEALRRDTPPSFAEIRSLITQYPKELLLEKDDREGDTPLFIALVGRDPGNPLQLPMDVIQPLIDACPDAILECDDEGNLPIQFTVGCYPLEIVRALINANPAGLKVQESESGDLPLHAAVLNGGVDVDTFTLIMQGYPEACKTRDYHNRIPLECVLRDDDDDNNGVGFEVVEALIRTFPGSLKIKDPTRGPFLFHKICSRYLPDISEEFIAFVKDSYPEVFLLPDEDGCLPLHCVMYALSVDQTAALHMIRACPEAASIAAADGQLPLHIMPAHTTDIVVKALLDAHPGAVVTKCHGQTPLHSLLERTGTQSDPFEVVKVLATARPKVLSIKDDEFGDTPLASTVRYRNHLPTVEWLINALPDSIKVANNDLQIPLHIAVSKRWASVEAVRALYQAWPGSVEQRDSLGRIPLALAVLNNSAPQDVVEFLLEVWPESARSKDSQGRIPLHRAIERNNVNVARVLIGAWSEGPQETDMNGNIPLFLACESLRNDNMVKLVLEAWPDSIRFTNMDGDLVIHTVTQRLRVFCAEEGLREQAFISRAKYLLDAWPESLLEQNRKRELPLHLLLENMGLGRESGSHKRKRDEGVNHQLEMIRLFVFKCPDSVEVVDGDGSIPLVTACKNKAISLDAIDFLVKASLNILLSSRRQTVPPTAGES